MDEDKYDLDVFFEKFSNGTRRKEPIHPVIRPEHTKKRTNIAVTSASNEQKKTGKLSDKALKRKDPVPNKMTEVNGSHAKRNTLKIRSNIIKPKCTVLKKRKSVNRNANELTSNSSSTSNSVVIIDDSLEEQTDKTEASHKPHNMLNKRIALESMSTRSASRTNITNVKKNPWAVMSVSRDHEKAVREYYSNLRSSGRERNLQDRNRLEQAKEKLMRENSVRNVTSTVTSGALTSTGTEPLKNFKPPKIKKSAFSSSSNWNGNASPYSAWNRDSDIAVARVIEENSPVLPSNACVPLETTQKNLNLGACPICFEDLLDTQIGATNCGHVFCMACITQTVETLKYCPNCRKRLELSDIISLYF